MQSRIISFASCGICYSRPSSNFVPEIFRFYFILYILYPLIFEIKHSNKLFARSDVITQKIREKSLGVMSECEQQDQVKQAADRCKALLPGQAIGLQGRLSVE